jgi:hypothetical protein
VSSREIPNLKHQNPRKSETNSKLSRRRAERDVYVAELAKNFGLAAIPESLRGFRYDGTPRYEA